MDNKIVCLFGGAFKPPTRAHFEVVQKAAKMCNEVKVIISNQDRGGYNSFISEKVWNQYKKLLPENVTIKVAENNSPITDIYKEIKNKDNKYLVIFGKGESDRFNAINERKEKYSNVEVLDIGNTENISATRLREAISKRDLKEIKKLIPEGIEVKDFLLNFQLHEVKIEKPLSFPKELLPVKDKIDFYISHPQEGNIEDKTINILTYILHLINHEKLEDAKNKFMIPKNGLKNLFQIIKNYIKYDHLNEVKINKPSRFSKEGPWYYLIYDESQLNTVYSQLNNAGLKWLSGRDIKNEGTNSINVPSIIGRSGSEYHKFPNLIFSNHSGISSILPALSTLDIKKNLLNPQDISKFVEKYKGRYPEYDWGWIPLKEEKIPGGLAKGKSLQDIAKHHKERLSTILIQLNKGIEVEMEHTTSKEIAKEIAMDHLWEDPKYYDKLASIEEIKINPPLTKSWEEVRDLSRYLMSKTSNKVQMRNNIDDILEKYGDVYMYLTTTEFLQEVSPKDLYSIYKELLQLKEKSNIKEGRNYHNKLVAMAKRKDPNRLTSLGKDYLPENWEYLEESKNLGDLYHFTSIAYAANILKTNNINGSIVPKNKFERDFQSYGKEKMDALRKSNKDTSVYYFSLTRDKLLYKKDPKIASFETRITFDGTKLSSKYKIIPFQYYSKVMNSPNSRYKFNENEERVLLGEQNKIPNIKNYVKNIDIILDVIKDNETYLNRAKALINAFPEVRLFYKEKQITYDDYVNNILPNLKDEYNEWEDFDEEILESLDKTIIESLGLDEIKINNPLFPDFKKDEDWIYVLEDKTHFEKTLNYLNSIGFKTRYGNNVIKWDFLENEIPIIFHSKDWDNEYIKSFIDKNKTLHNDDLSIILNPKILKKLNSAYKLNENNFIALLNKCMDECCNELNVTKPNLEIITDNSYTKQYNSYGGYSPEEQKIFLVVYERTLADCCRSLAHELKHHQQNLQGILTKDAGKDGDEFENECNSFSGEFMRKFGRSNPDIYFMKLN